MELSTSVLPSENYAFDNKLYGCHEMIKEGYYKLINQNTVYMIVPFKMPIRCSLGLNRVLRNKYLLGLNDKIMVEEYEIKAKNTKIGKITFNVSSVMKIKINGNTIHEDQIKDEIMKTLRTHYFYVNQLLMLKNDDMSYALFVESNSEGYIGDMTEIELKSNDINFNLISSKLLKRDLFRKEYDFTQLGIGGMSDELMEIFRRALSTRAYKPDVIKKMGINHVKGILLYGPPGTGKTLIARKIGNLISDIPPKIVNGPEVLNKYVGGSEQNIRNLFVDAEKDYKYNRENAKLHVIIFDEIDAICKTRGASGTHSEITDSLVNQLLTKIQGVNEVENVFIIAMTNRIDLLDSALIRPGRIEVHIEIGLPNKQGREQIFGIHTNSMIMNRMISNDVDLCKLAELTENYSGAEIEAVIKNASSYTLNALLASDNEIIESNIRVDMSNFLRAIDQIVPAFGNVDRNIQNLLPKTVLALNFEYIEAYHKAMELINKHRRLKTILIHGENGCGKSTFVIDIGLKSKIKFTKFIRAIDIVSMGEHDKMKYIKNIIDDSYLSENSLVILDDIEIILDYSELGNTIHYSNRVYQLIQTILKTEPKYRNHELTIMMTCGNNNVKKIFDKNVDESIMLNSMSKSDIYEIFGINVDESMSIRKVLNMTG